MDIDADLATVPTDAEEHSPRLSRRGVLAGMLFAPAAAVIGQACGGGGDAASPAATTGSSASPTAPTATSGSTVAASTNPPSSAATVAESSTTAASAPARVGWASGGTELITVGYPDTGIFASATTCSVSLTQGTTEGPCYFHDDTTDDISDGTTGLPMQLCVQLVDESCAPLAGYTFEVWSCDRRGIYSGDTSASADPDRFAGSFCTADDAEATSSTYLRGQATTDAEGRANFATIFPGWYRGRTIHVHFAVSDPDGTTRVISQWCFDDDFTEEICTTHELYAERGVQDTPLAGGTDTVFGAEGYEDFMLTLEQNPDGTLLGYGIVQIDPASVATEVSGGAPGGPGGDGFPGEGDGPPPPPPG